jgi:sulfatase modifying factor 1
MYEVTVGEFRQFVNDRAYETDAEKQREGVWGYDAAARRFVGPRTEFAWHHAGFPQTDDHPVVYISWNDAQAFCRWLSQKEGVEYRLPTEAEWEYACRAGTGTLYQNGDDPQKLPELGNAWDAGVQKKFFNAAEPLLPNDGHVFTAPVGQFKPNEFGLFDMHGNVWEWCADVFNEDYYLASPADDPPGAARGAGRVLRGGAWDKFAASCGSSFRTGKPRANPGYSTGFRVARSLGE